MRATFVFVILAVLGMMASLVVGQSYRVGTCPPVSLQQNFNTSRYMGKWYEYKRYFNKFSIAATCVTANYFDQGNGTVGVRNEQYMPLKHKPMSINGTATMKNSTNEGNIGIRFPSVGPFESPYQVLGTDYTSYSVVYSCITAFVFRIQSAWVLTRARYPTAATVAAADAILTANNISKEYFSITNQYNCPN